MALMSFQASRLQARLTENGQIIVLKYQDRSKWDRQLISKGFSYLEIAAEPFEISTYHFEAAIASLHATASNFEQTDWTSIFHLYEKLYALQPNPVVAMNKAIASAYANDKKNALNDLLEIKGLSEYYLYHTTIGELYAELNEWKQAAEYYQHALGLTTSIAEKEFLQQKIQKCKLN
jgi:RNA polymerase sigma-70 factor (ECF subfamily)